MGSLGTPIADSYGKVLCQDVRDPPLSRNACGRLGTCEVEFEMKFVTCEMSKIALAAFVLGLFRRRGG